MDTSVLLFAYQKIAPYKHSGAQEYNDELVLTIK